MKNERWQKIKDTFLDVLEEAPENRESFLAGACGDDREMRREIRQLLASHDEIGEFIEQPAGNVLTVFDVDSTEMPQRAGVYRILRELGRGGMGTVYLAERDDDQFRKQVAVKLVKRGLGTDDILTRFRHERQLLAQLEHPFIARLLDGGATDSGEPFLVMEYVDGLPLTEHCEAHEYSTEERLELFLKVCEAVRYAHQNLVIHRDIKPSNILVRPDGTPSLLDFGVAKLLQSDSGKNLTETIPAFRIVTPEYASPEQIRGQKVTTSTDVYSLGIVLYELLSGVRPYAFDSNSLDEMIRVVCETEPKPPSAAVSFKFHAPGSKPKGDTSRNEQRTTSNELKTNPKSKTQNPKLLKSDLDNIVLMALRKEPERRYSSVEQFAADVRRYLKGLPVIARKDTLTYRAEKFIKRHRAGAAGAALILLAILGGVIATLWQAGIARAEARRAAEERDRARIEQNKAERINNFLREMFAAADTGNRGREIKVVEVLESAERQAQTELAQQPEVLAAVLQTIGSTYDSLSQYEPAQRNLSAALGLYERSPGDNRKAIAECKFTLANILMLNQKFDDAEPLMRDAVEIQRRFLPETNKDLIRALGGLGSIFRGQGKYDEAERTFQDALEIARQANEEESAEALFVLNAIAVLRNSRNDSDGEIEIYRRLIPILRKQNQKNYLATTLRNLAFALMNRGEFDESDSTINEALSLIREVQGDGNTLANAVPILARLRMWQGRYREAQAEAEKALDMQKKYVPPGHSMFVSSLSVIGESLTKQGKPREGEPFLRQAVEIAQKSAQTGGGSWNVFLQKSRLGECLAQQNRFPEAEPLLVNSYEKIKAILSERHLLTRDCLRRVVDFYEKSKNINKAAFYRAHLEKSGNES